jgi:hypothetical protein
MMAGIGQYLRPAVLTALVVATACSSIDPQDPAQERLGKSASAVTTSRYEAEAMSWSGAEGVDGEIRTAPAPTHRYFWNNGHVFQNHSFVGGSTTVTVRARGELLAGVGPHIVVKVGNAEVGSTYVNETAYVAKTFTFNATAGVQEIRVAYDNDGWSGGVDRNLLMDWLEIEEPETAPSCSNTSYEAEAMSWSGAEGVDGQIRTSPAPTHRYFWNNGYIFQNHSFIPGPTRIRVRAKGELVGGVGPHLKLSVGGVEIGSADVNETGYVDKLFVFTATAGTQQLRVTYDNDTWIAPGGPGNDRNLLVDKVEVLCGAGAGNATYPTVPGAPEWKPTSGMAVRRNGHSSLTLADGRVLVSGGSNYDLPVTATAELYEPISGTWQTTTSMNQARVHHASLLLPDGRVLVAGGHDQIAALASAELFDPLTETWSSAGAMSQARSGHAIIEAWNYEPLVVGGSGTGALASAEVFNPATLSWRSVGSLTTARYQHRLAELPSKQIVAISGARSSGLTSSVEVYDPSTEAWAHFATLTTARIDHTATRLRTGRIVVTGGVNSSGAKLATTEIIDPSGTVSPGPNMATARFGHTAVLLQNGRVLVVGGECDDINCTETSEEVG